MTLRPSTAPQRVAPPSPPASSLPAGPDLASDSQRAASPSVARFMATASPSASVCPPSVGGECALGTDVLDNRQEEFECFAAVSPHLVSMLLAPEGDPDALDIPTPRSYAEAIEGPYSSQWQAAMDAEMASWKSTGTYVDEVPPPGANIVSGIWIFRVKRPPGSPPAIKARYVARGFSQRQGVDFFQTFSPTPKMTTLRVPLHVAAQHDYELNSLDFSIAFLQGSLHEEIWLRRPPGFNGSFPTGTQWSLRRPVYSLRQAPREWHDTLTMTLAVLGFAPSASDPSLFLRTDTTLPPFYVLVYVDDLVFATADSEALAHVKSKLQKRHTCTDLGEVTSYLGLRITRDRAQRTITLTQSHMVQQALQRFGFTYSSPQSTPLPTGHSLSTPPSDESVEPSGPYPELVGCLMYLMTCTRPNLAYPLSLLARYVAPGRHRKVHWDGAKRVLRYLCSTSGMGLVLGGRARVVLTGHADASWVDDLATQRSSQGYTFSLGSGSVSWRSTHSSSVLSSSCEAEIYAEAMAAQELRWLTYLLTDLGEAPRSSPVLSMASFVVFTVLFDTPRITARYLASAAALPCHELPRLPALQRPALRVALLPCPCTAAALPRQARVSATTALLLQLQPLLLPLQPLLLPLQPLLLPLQPLLLLQPYRCRYSPAVAAMTPAAAATAPATAATALLLQLQPLLLPLQPYRCRYSPCCCRYKPTAAATALPLAREPHLHAPLPCNCRANCCCTCLCCCYSHPRPLQLPLPPLCCCWYLRLFTINSVSLLENTSGSLQAPMTPTEPGADAGDDVQWRYPADSLAYTQWTKRDAVARHVIRAHLPDDQRDHFRQVTSAQSLYDALVRHYSSLSHAAWPLQQRRPLLGEVQQLVEEASVGACASACTGGAASGGGGSGGGQQRQQKSASLGACESASTCVASAEALLTFTLDSGTSHCLFRDCTTVTPLTTPVLVTLLDTSSGLVVARGTTVLLCPTVPSGSLTGFHLPPFTTNLVSQAVLQDQLVTTTTPEGQLVAICTDSVTGDHLATFTRRPGFGLYTLHVESAHFAGSGQVAVSCSCRSLTHLSLVWHHHLGHPSLQCHCRMHSCLLVSGLPRSLPPLPPSLAPPWTPCIEGRQHAAPHSSSFPPTEAPLQTLHMDVWGPAPVPGLCRERYFLLVVDDYTRYTMVFPLRSKGDVRRVLIPWIRTVRCQLRARFRQDLLVLHLHSDRGGEFSSGLLEDFCHEEGITQSFMLPASPQQNGITECRIGLVMEPVPVDSGASRGGGAGGVGSDGADTGGACSRGAEPGGAEPGGVAFGVGRRGDSAGAGSGDAEREGAATRGNELVVADSGGGGTGAGGAEAAGAGGTGARGAGGSCTRGAGAGGTVTGGFGRTRAGSTGGFGAAQPPYSPVPSPSPYTEQTDSLTERREPASHPASPVRTVHWARHVRPPPVPSLHTMVLRPPSVPQRVALPSPPASSLFDVPDPESDLVRIASPTVTRVLATLVTEPTFESVAASALVTEPVDFAVACRLDYVATLVTEAESDCPPSVGGECALSTDVLEDRQFELKCLTDAVPHLASMLLAPEGDPDALDIPTPRSYVEAISSPYSSQWKTAMDAKMASWKSAGTYVDAVPPPVANIVDGMWIFRVKRPPSSPPVFKARYVARGFSQRQGVEFFQTFSPTPTTTTLRVLLQVATERDYKLHSLDFSTAFLKGSLHEEIWLHLPPGFTGSFPEGT
ncbi:unnamed protein product [Closterium sp. NIES-54]